MYFRVLNFFIFCTIFATFCPQNATSAKILSISFMSSRSQKITYEPLLEALAAKGHEVTVVSPIPAKKTVKNLKEIFTIDVDRVMSYMPNMFKYKEENKQIDLSDMAKHMAQICRDSMDLPEVQALRSEEFDLIFVPAIMNECTVGFVSTFKTNVILISPLSVPAIVASAFGNPSPPSFVPHFIAGYTDTMTFYERIVNLCTEAYWNVMMAWSIAPTMESVYREKLGHDTPGLYDIFQNASLILSNSHFSIATIRPFLPDIIEVGGMHCRPAEPLPKDLEDFVSSSGDDGFILFSMGSLVKANTMPEEKRKMLVNVFSKLKQKVIWKWEAEHMDDLPNNVKLSKWVPQQDVLGHPKIKAFITHGGFGSTTEAVYHGVPVVGLPIFGDQQINMQLAANLGFGVVLDFTTFTEESLMEAITNILKDPKYKKQAAAISSSFRDQPIHPLDRAVYWSEYVIRHNGAPHLRSAARNLNFFQYHSLDVIGLIAAVVIAALWIIAKILKVSIKLLCRVFFAKPTASKIAKSKKRR